MPGTRAGDGEGWIDISVPIHTKMVHWPGDPPAELDYAKHIERGDPATVTRLGLGAHTGTHVDAPAHFFAGAPGVDAVPLTALIGRARVVEIPETRRIGEGELSRRGCEPGEIVLLKTDNSSRCWRRDDFVPDYSYLAPSGARLLAERGVRTVGIDYLSVGGGDDNVETHRILHEASIAVVEGLDLSRAQPGLYDFICLPLKLEGRDGAPARAALRRVATERETGWNV